MAKKRIKKVPGFPRYKVSDRGDVYGPRGKMKGQKDKNGYLLVRLKNKKGIYLKRVNRLILKAFKKLPSKKHHACHGNGIRDDNRLCNLRWATALENAQDKIKHGTNSNGEQHGQYKLSYKQVKQIRDVYNILRIKNGKRNWGEKILAKKYEVSVSTIRRTIRGESRCSHPKDAQSLYLIKHK